MKKTLTLIILLFLACESEAVMEYIGSRELCIKNVTNNESCLSSSQEYTFIPGDYDIRIYPATRTFNAGMSSSLVAIILGLLGGAFLIFFIFQVMRYYAE